MYLLLDLSVRDSVSVTVFDSTSRSLHTQDGKNVALLAVIDTVLQSEQKTADDVAGIAVVVAAGTFTGTRLAVTVANTFAFAKQIPVVAVLDDQKEDTATLIKELDAATPGLFISATYSGMPRIG